MFLRLPACLYARSYRAISPKTSRTEGPLGAALVLHRLKSILRHRVPLVAVKKVYLQQIIHELF